jgi:hypothetical protein|tara:strand:- start:189 stop:602 length:414 start_codon:yes stop_codon:yes gene_type:complete
LVVKNKNMSSPFQKKFTEKRINTTTPLLGSYDRGGRGDIYVSKVASIQKAVGSVQNAINSYMNEDSQHKADRLAARVTSRKDRFSHKDEEDKNTAYSNVTSSIAGRAADAQIKANKKATKKQTMLEKELAMYKAKNK